ncbi:hypothetical protein SAMN05444413_10997 [Roseivivax marinus]|uniref:hypothetical protein n=1 Tax=Roseivivax marinus TaxID=1379903 RepID=UPI0008B0EB00|nr:hypothetical protein [Roseivivax marinus]SEL45883.1 hypothetical protein SAMN05444413_10997 [Roseivivax marinus]
MTDWMKTAACAAFLAAATGGAMTSAASAQNAEQCAVQADLVMEVVQSRGEGRSAAETVEAVQSNLEGPRAEYASVVPAIADWVYTLPEDQLGPGVGESWTEACKAR